MATQSTASEATERTTMEIRKSVRVPLSQAAAFELFTTGIGSWWPTATHSVAETGEAGAHLEAGIGGRIYEDGPDGTVPWGTITAWEAPSGFSSTWHPGYGPELATRLTVRFIAEGPATTRVELEHVGWEVHGDAAEEKARGYTSGWNPVLARYVERAGG